MRSLFRRSAVSTRSNSNEIIESVDKRNAAYYALRRRPSTPSSPACTSMRKSVRWPCRTESCVSRFAFRVYPWNRFDGRIDATRRALKSKQPKPNVRVCILKFSAESSVGLYEYYMYTCDVGRYSIVRTWRNGPQGEILAPRFGQYEYNMRRIGNDGYFGKVLARDSLF